MDKAWVLFWAVFLCGFTLKCGESVGELICLIIKQTYLLLKEKKALKRLQAKSKHSGGI